MASFKWQTVASENLGPTQVPVAHVRLVSPAGVVRQFLMLVDSGATVTLVRRSVATLLQVDLTSGRPTELKAVGGARNRAFIHHLGLRFGEDTGETRTIPVAISERENVPNLLGRAGVFDRMQVWFDPTMAETSFLPRWGSEQDAAVYRFFLASGEDIIRRWNPAQQNKDLAQAVGSLIWRASRLYEAILGLVQLDRVQAAPPLLRSLFELSLEFEYLMRDPVNRAAQFTAYRAISQKKQLEKWGSAGPMGRRIHQRGAPADRARVDAEFAANAPQFRDAKGRLYFNWYKMSIEKLADTVGRLDEYRFWYSPWCVWSHGDPFLMKGERSLLVHCDRFYARMLLALGSDLVLTAEQFEALKVAAAPHA